MLDVPSSDEQSNSKLKNLLLTASIFSLFVMNPHQTQAQKLDKTKDMWSKEYYQDHMMLFNLPQKDVNVEFPGRDKYFLSLIHPKFKEISTPKQQIEHKTQLAPLSFAKRNIRKYFAEREACFKEIISVIEQDPTLAYNINAILQKTVMKPQMVHKETNRRPRTEKDITGAILLFLEGTMGRNNFSQAIDQKDKADEYRSDSITYEQRLAKIDKCEIAPEMIQSVLEADAKYRIFIDHYLAEHQEITAESDSITASR